VRGADGGAGDTYDIRPRGGAPVRSSRREVRGARGTYAAATERGVTVETVTGAAGAAGAASSGAGAGTCTGSSTGFTTLDTTLRDRALSTLRARRCWWACMSDNSGLQVYFFHFSPSSAGRTSAEAGALCAVFGRSFCKRQR
jgi:hypothetical protein